MSSSSSKLFLRSSYYSDGRAFASRKARLNVCGGQLFFCKRHFVLTSTQSKDGKNTSTDKNHRRAREEALLRFPRPRWRVRQRRGDFCAGKNHFPERELLSCNFCLCRVTARAKIEESSKKRRILRFCAGAVIAGCVESPSRRVHGVLSLRSHSAYLAERRRRLGSHRVLLRIRALCRPLHRANLQVLFLEERLVGERRTSACETPLLSLKAPRRAAIEEGRRWLSAAIQVVKKATKPLF